MTSTAQVTGAGSRQEAVLAALAAGILGEAFDPAVPGRILEILGRTASRRDREQLLGGVRVERVDRLAELDLADRLLDRLAHLADDDLG